MNSTRNVTLNTALTGTPAAIEPSEFEHEPDDHREQDKRPHQTGFPLGQPRGNQPDRHAPAGHHSAADGQCEPGFAGGKRLGAVERPGEQIDQKSDQTGQWRPGGHGEKDAERHENDGSGLQDTRMNSHVRLLCCDGPAIGAWSAVPQLPAG
ncbi:hypothetical protein [Oceaniradius stylonematis]|uniref:hypothetical protein n=1 Tax=Oceaniradius stylonematis TaxID=2184161 RepID=UPI0035D12F4D